MDASAPPTVTITIRPPLEPQDLPGLCTRVCALLEEHRGAAILCEVGGIAADAVAIDALARLQLGARRHGCRIRLRDASADLLTLVAFLGLSDVLAG
jgi:ABC-type transporter Mla MlaB component